MHIIAKKTTDSIKGVAIIIVVIGHYARYMESPFPVASHIAYFGAALFAFLSGYGAIVSYKDKGIDAQGYILGRIKRVYIPFIFINSLSVIVYGFNSKSIVTRILLGIDDSAMWYVVFILGFYITFLAIYILKLEDYVKLTLLVGCLGGVYCIFVQHKIPSQWYTSIFPLIAGIFIANYEDVYKKLKKKIGFPAIALCIICAVAARNITGNLKYLITGLSGMYFSVAIIFLFELLEDSEKIQTLMKRLACIGAFSYQCYLVHMKVFYLIDKFLGTGSVLSFFVYFCGIITATYLFAGLWKFIECKFTTR